MQKQKNKNVKLVFWAIVYVLIAWLGNRAVFGVRTAPGNDINEKVMSSLNVIIESLTVNPFPSFHMYDLLGGVTIAGLVWYIKWNSRNSKKKFRSGKEHGSAIWGTENDMQPFTDYKNPDNNIILTQTEWLTMGVGAGAMDRNKNVLCIGAPGTGKTLFVVKPGLMQMHPMTSFVTTDPKGSVLEECGSMLKKGRMCKTKDGRTVYKSYKIKVFNTFDFSESMHYNPFAYFLPATFTEDVETFITMFQENTGETKENTGDKFFPSAEKLLYKACIGAIFTLFSEKDRNINTLCDLITNLTADDNEGRGQGKKTKPSKTEILFMAMEDWLADKLAGDTKDPQLVKRYKGFNFTKSPTESERKNGEYAINNYKRFKQAAGKTMKSILISCSARLGVFDSNAIRKVISKDDLGLDKIGDELTALFIITDDSDPTFNFLAAIMYAQMYKLLFKRASKMPGKRLKYHVRFILDEFANIGKIPTFEKKISVFRSRNISCCIILQAMSQLKTMYKDDWDTVVAGCDSILFLGGSEMTTLEWLVKMLGKETIDTRNYSLSRGGSGSYTTSDQKSGRELMTIDELRLLDGRKCILLIRGVKPFLSMKYNVSGHKNYNRLGDNKNGKLFNIKNYIEIKSKPPKCVIEDNDEIRIINK
jgi:type IV secretion system protein VirD4